MYARVCSRFRSRGGVLVSWKRLRSHRQDLGLVGGLRLYGGGLGLVVGALVSWGNLGHMGALGLVGVLSLMGGGPLVSWVGLRTYGWALGHRGRGGGP